MGPVRREELEAAEEPRSYCFIVLEVGSPKIKGSAGAASLEAALLEGVERLIYTQTDLV